MATAARSTSTSIVHTVMFAYFYQAFHPGGTLHLE